jgi:glycosyltransferase involved in cell wall biosynthesis
VFGPGGSNFTGFTPFVAMSQNMLPFEARERSRYFLSVSYIRLVLLRFSQARAFKRADGVIFLTTYARRVIEDSIGGCQGEVAIIPHGIAQKFLEVGKKVRDVPLDGSGKIQLLYVSIIDRYKHQWNVVEAIHSLRCRLKLDLQLVLAGPAESWSLKKLAKSIRKLDAQHSWVNYIGPVAHDQLEALYAEAHVGIFASSCENMPIILLEKMGAGLPIACSSRGPMFEVAGDSVVYFDPESPASISDAVEALVVSIERRCTLTTRAADCANQFSWVKSSQSTFRFIEGIVERLKRPASK